MKTIVSLVSHQTLPNYLFVKEIFEKGDQLLFISTQEMEKNISRTNLIAQSLGVDEYVEPIIVFEENWQKIQDKLGEFISVTSEAHYIVNLTGGTKYLALAVYDFFNKLNDVQFFYIPYPKNELISPGAAEAYCLKYRCSVEEYLSNYGVPFKSKTVQKSKELTERFFNFFIDGFSNEDYESVLEVLREPYRRFVKKKIEVDKIENYNEGDGKNKVPIRGLKNFQKKVGFEFELDESYLTKKDIEYLTGGWFEEYIFHKIVENINPDDITIGLEIKAGDITNQQDLDIVFTKGNKLFVVECKTGLNQKYFFNQATYKAAAVKEKILGLSANTYLFSLSSEKEDFNRIARNMGINYFSREYFTDEKKFVKITDHISQKSFN